MKHYIVLPDLSVMQVVDAVILADFNNIIAVVMAESTVEALKKYHLEKN